MTTESTPKKVCLIATMPSLVYMFSRDYISYLRDHGWEVTVMTAPDQKGFGTRDYVQELRDRGAKFVFIPMKRPAEPLRRHSCLPANVVVFAASSV